MGAAALAALVTGCVGGSAGHDSAQARSSCPLENTDSALTMTLPASCKFGRTDTAADPNAFDLWGDSACVPGQVDWDPSGGDPDPTASGTPQRNRAFRKLTVIDGDNPDGDGERCELGKNSYVDGIAGLRNPAGTFYNYNEGMRRATYFSLRLPGNFPINVDTWQVVMQMKQSGPSNNSGIGTPILEMDAWAGRWRLRQSLSQTGPSDSRQLWSAPARTGVWTRFAYDVTYSQDPNVGRIKVYVDLNGDGDFADAGEQSQTFHTYTLKEEIPGPDQGLQPGESIPSHLRMGIYHDPAIACPAPSGCSVNIDNVEVAKP